MNIIQAFLPIKDDPSVKECVSDLVYRQYLGYLTLPSIHLLPTSHLSWYLSIYLNTGTKFGRERESKTKNYQFSSLNNMGKLVKLIGSGLGLASEAIHDYRARSNSRSTQTGQSQTGQSPSSPLSPNTAVASSSRSLQAGLDGPPEYSDAVGGSSSGQQVSRGSREAGGQPSRGNNAEGSSRNEKRSKAAEAGYRDEEEEEDEDDESSSSSNGEDGDGEDEEAWELDEMAERVAPPSYVEAVSEQDLSEEGKIKKEEQMIRDMVRLAGAPPQPPRRLPCPVIIPQRRPRNKDRGFVRAYAPVLEECGISQEVFLKFLQDWLVASKVSPTNKQTITCTWNLCYQSPPPSRL